MRLPMAAVLAYPSPVPTVLRTTGYVYAAGAGNEGALYLATLAHGEYCATYIECYSLLWPSFAATLLMLRRRRTSTLGRRDVRQSFEGALYV
jgi:hypothetical protein